MAMFNARGHENILATHRTTLEFTRDSHLTKRGDCIVAVAADFSLEQIKKLHGRVKITIRCSGREESLTAEANPGFSNSQEMVIRKSGFASARTFAINADKSAKDLGIKLVAADSSTEYHFFGKVSQEKINEIVEKLRLLNTTVEYVGDKEPKTLLIPGKVGPTKIIPLRKMSDENLLALANLN